MSAWTALQAWGKLCSYAQVRTQTTSFTCVSCVSMPGSCRPSHKLRISKYSNAWKLGVENIILCL